MRQCPAWAYAAQRDACSDAGAKQKRTPRKVRCAVYIQAQPGGAGDRGRTGTVSLPLDFESSTSANSITPAELLTARFIIQYEKRKSKIKMKKL